MYDKRCARDHVNGSPVRIGEGAKNELSWENASIRVMVMSIYHSIRQRTTIQQRHSLINPYFYFMRKFNSILIGYIPENLDITSEIVVAPISTLNKAKERVSRANMRTNL